MEWNGGEGNDSENLDLIVERDSERGRGAFILHLKVRHIKAQNDDQIPSRYSAVLDGKEVPNGDKGGSGVDGIRAASASNINRRIVEATTEIGLRSRGGHKMGSVTDIGKAEVGRFVWERRRVKVAWPRRREREDRNQEAHATALALDLFRQPAPCTMVALRMQDELEFKTNDQGEENEADETQENTDNALPTGSKRKTAGTKSNVQPQAWRRGTSRGLGPETGQKRITKLPTDSYLVLRKKKLKEARQQRRDLKDQDFQKLKDRGNIDHLQAVLKDREAPSNLLHGAISHLAPKDDVPSYDPEFDSYASTPAMTWIWEAMTIQPTSNLVSSYLPTLLPKRAHYTISSTPSCTVINPLLSEMPRIEDNIRPG
ncbi:hypothetical protein FRC04_009603 [Tulasnella sp. 424]|nr:hypothetical protein FRC04_009603 [Tulasnella sp. 424]